MSWGQSWFFLPFRELNPQLPGGKRGPSPLCRWRGGEGWCLFSEDKSSGLEDLGDFSFLASWLPLPFVGQPGARLSKLSQWARVHARTHTLTQNTHP